MKLGIIGKGFVGPAVSNGFTNDTEQFIVDPAINSHTIKDLVEWNPDMIFVCVPTPQQESHLDVDTHIVRDVLLHIGFTDYANVVVVKSTITPNHLTQFKNNFSGLRLV